MLCLPSRLCLSASIQAHVYSSTSSFTIRPESIRAYDFGIFLGILASLPPISSHGERSTVHARGASPFFSQEGARCQRSSDCSRENARCSGSSDSGPREGPRSGESFDCFREDAQCLGFYSGSQERAQCCGSQKMRRISPPVVHY